MPLNLRQLHQELCANPRRFLLTYPMRLSGHAKSLVVQFELEDRERKGMRPGHNLGYLAMKETETLRVGVKGSGARKNVERFDFMALNLRMQPMSDKIEQLELDGGGPGRDADGPAERLRAGDLA